MHIRSRINRKAQNDIDMKNTIDSFYVLYVLTYGKIDDIIDCIKTLKATEWKSLPI